MTSSGSAARWPRPARPEGVCYYDVPHHPFHHLWNAYSPFAKCDIIEISDISELKTVKPVVRD